MLIGLAAALPRRWRPAPTPPTSTSPRSSAATPKSSAAARSHRRLLAEGRRQPDPVDPRRRRRRPLQRLPELADSAELGARFELREVHIEEPGMSPREIWSNESQERYVLAIAPESPAGLPGHLRARALPVRGGRHGHRRRPAGGLRPPLRQQAGRHGNAGLLGKPPKMTRNVSSRRRSSCRPSTSPTSSLDDACAACRCRRWPARTS